PEPATLLRPRFSKRGEEEPVRRAARHGRDAFVHVERVVHQRGAGVVAVARNEPPEERRHRRKIRSTREVGRDDDAWPELERRSGLEVFAGYEVERVFVGIPVRSAVTEALENHERVLVDLTKLR